MDTQTLSPPLKHCKSPEFEFWMTRNPCFPQPDILPADQLISHGVLLPLHHLKPQIPPQPDPDPQPDPEARPDPAPPLSSSKRWRDLFKKKGAEIGSSEEKVKKKERKNNSGGGGGGGSAELNINIWPFSRSRSAGTRPRVVAGAPVARRVNSAPCSRSNSTGESKARKWPSSPGRAGVHLGRSSPVWQVPRPKAHDPKEPTAVARRSKVAAAAGGGKSRVLSLNVPTCIGYKQHLSCRSDVNSAVSVAGSTAVGTGRSRRGNGGASGGSRNVSGNSGNIFSFRSIFSKKSVVSSH